MKYSYWRMAAISVAILGLPRLGIAQATSDASRARVGKEHCVPDRADTAWANDSTSQPPLRWLREGALNFHTCFPMPLAVRFRLANDTAATRYYAELLEGTRTESIPWDTTDAGRWVMLSRNPRYIPLLLRFATLEQEARRHELFIMGVMGLARHAQTVPMARARLDSLFRVASRPSAYYQVAFALHSVNDAAAREALSAALPVLRAREAQFRERRFAARVERALKDPPCTPGRYWSEWSGFEGQHYHGCVAWDYMR